MRVVLVDSSSILHQCFHGYPPRPATLPPRGHSVDVAAVFGYLYGVRKLEKEFSFDRLVHVLDPEGGSAYRYGLYPDYKANRPPNDPVLQAQKLLLPKVLTTMGQRVVQKKGVESDDIIATLAEHYVAQGHEVLVVTSDKDLFQLVRDGAISVARRVDRPDGFGKTYEVYEEEHVFRKMGVHPHQIPDYLALVGDDVDNIPGVPNCGPKTAAAWLAEHGDLPTIMTQAAAIKGRGSNDLRNTLDKLPLYRQLTDTLRDIDGVVPPEELPLIEAGAISELRQWMKLPVEWPDRLFEVEGDARSATVTFTLMAVKPVATPAASVATATSSTEAAGNVRAENPGASAEPPSTPPTFAGRRRPAATAATSPSGEETPAAPTPPAPAAAPTSTPAAPALAAATAAAPATKSLTDDPFGDVFGGDDPLDSAGHAATEVASIPEASSGTNVPPLPTRRRPTMG